MGQSSAKAWESCYKFPFVDSNAALPVQLKKSAKMRMPDPFFQMMGKPLIEYRKLPQNHYRTYIIHVIMHPMPLLQVYTMKN